MFKIGLNNFFAMSHSLQKKHESGPLWGGGGLDFKHKRDREEGLKLCSNLNHIIYVMESSAEQK